MSSVAGALALGPTARAQCSHPGQLTSTHNHPCKWNRGEPPFCRQGNRPAGVQNRGEAPFSRQGNRPAGVQPGVRSEIFDFPRSESVFLPPWQNTDENHLLKANSGGR